MQQLPGKEWWLSTDERMLSRCRMMAVAGAAAARERVVAVHRRASALSLQGGDELLEGRRISMSPEAVPAYDVDVLVGSAAREAGSLLQVPLDSGVCPFLKSTTV